MPNWVINKVQFEGNKEKIRELKDFVNSETSKFDFNKVIPMPEELSIESGSDETIAKACAKARRNGKTTCPEFDTYYSADKTFDEWADLGEKYLSNIKKYNFSTWYGWRNYFWNTKWNSCYTEWESDDFVEFNTAWDVPTPIYKKLSELFPDVYFTVVFANEDLGSGCGTIEYSETGFREDYVDSFEFACDAWGYDAEEMKEEE